MVHQSLYRAIAGFSILSLAATSALAQGPRPGGAPQPAGGLPPAAAAPRASGAQFPHGGVALIDLGYILKNHAGFQQKSEEFRQQWEGREADIKAKQESLRKLATQLNEFNKGSAQYKQLEEELTKRNGDLQVEVNITKKKFAEAEAKLFYDAYKQIYNEVRLHCEQNSIVMVIKFNGESPNPENPEEIGSEMFNKQVLYYNPAVDITPLVLDRLKGQVGRAAPPASAQRPGLPQRPQ